MYTEEVLCDALTPGEHTFCTVESAQRCLPSLLFGARGGNYQEPFTFSASYFFAQALKALEAAQDSTGLGELSDTHYITKIVH